MPKALPDRYSTSFPSQERIDCFRHRQAINSHLAPYGPKPYGTPPVDMTHSMTQSMSQTMTQAMTQILTQTMTHSMSQIVKQAVHLPVYK